MFMFGILHTVAPSCVAAYVVCLMLTDHPISNLTLPTNRDPGLKRSGRHCSPFSHSVIYLAVLYFCFLIVTSRSQAHGAALHYICHAIESPSPGHSLLMDHQ